MDHYGTQPFREKVFEASELGIHDAQLSQLRLA